MLLLAKKNKKERITHPPTVNAELFKSANFIKNTANLTPHPLHAKHKSSTWLYKVGCSDGKMQASICAAKGSVFRFPFCYITTSLPTHLVPLLSCVMGLLSLRMTFTHVPGEEVAQPKMPPKSAALGPPLSRCTGKKSLTVLHHVFFASLEVRTQVLFKAPSHLSSLWVCDNDVTEPSKKMELLLACFCSQS